MPNNKQEGIQTHILISQAAKFHLMATKGNNQYPKTNRLNPRLGFAIITNPNEINHNLIIIRCEMDKI